MARPRKFGTCGGCGRTINPQREHNDPTLCECIACETLVCDWCYHVHYNQKHEPQSADKPGT